MNRLDLAKALTEMDEEWIEEARQVRPSPWWRKAWPLTAAVALALLFLWSSWTQPAVVARFQGQVLTATAFNLGDLSNLPSPATSGPRSFPGLTLPLRLELDEPRQVEAESGLLFARTDAGAVVLEDGTRFEAAGVVDLSWTIDPAQPGPFRLLISGDGDCLEILLTQTADGTWQLSQLP